tara:strand:+ start:2306 stop:2827 length:522 start_codon:yes stop_codon:yes gene_type:complete
MKKKKPSFEQAMNAATLWCNAWEEGTLSDEVLADRIGELVDSPEGARGFFVISLSGEWTLMDRLPDPIIFQLRKAGEMVVELAVKNLVMSSAMTVEHKRKKNLGHLAGSKKVARRCIDLLRLLDPNQVKIQLESVLEGTLKGEGNFVAFFKVWQYDSEQKTEISRNINAVAIH